MEPKLTPLVQWLPCCSSGRWSQTSMVSTRPAPTTATLTSSWRGLASTSKRRQVCYQQNNPILSQSYSVQHCQCSFIRQMTTLCIRTVGALLARSMDHCGLHQALGNPVIEQLYLVLYVLFICVQWWILHKEQNNKQLPLYRKHCNNFVHVIMACPPAK
jgi:hypothetical protein